MKKLVLITAVASLISSPAFAGRVAHGGFDSINLPVLAKKEGNLNDDATGNIVEGTVISFNPTEVVPVNQEIEQVDCSNERYKAICDAAKIYSDERYTASVNYADGKVTDARKDARDYSDMKYTASTNYINSQINDVEIYADNLYDDAVSYANRKATESTNASQQYADSRYSDAQKEAEKYADFKYQQSVNYSNAKYNASKTYTNQKVTEQYHHTNNMHNAQQGDVNAKYWDLVNRINQANSQINQIKNTRPDPDHAWSDRRD